MLLVLIVEGDAPLAAGLASLVRGLGHVPVVVLGAAAALAAIGAGGVDLMVLSDVLAGGESGLGVLRAVRAGGASNGVPVVVFAADAGLRDEAVGLGAGFVVKTDVNALWSWVARHADGAAAP